MFYRYHHKFMWAASESIWFRSNWNALKGLSLLMWNMTLLCMSYQAKWGCSYNSSDIVTHMRSEQHIWHVLSSCWCNCCVKHVNHGKHTQTCSVSSLLALICLAAFLFCRCPGAGGLFMEQVGFQGCVARETTLLNFCPHVLPHCGSGRSHEEEKSPPKCSSQSG